MTDKPERRFVVVSDGEATFCEAKTPRAAAVNGLNSVEHAESNAVEVFELGRGKKYVRQSTAVPAGK